MSNVKDLSEELLNNQENYNLAKYISKEYIKVKKEKETTFLEEIETKFKENYEVKAIKQRNWHCVDINKNLQFRFYIQEKDGLTLQITQLNTNFQAILDINKKGNHSEPQNPNGIKIA